MEAGTMRSWRLGGGRKGRGPGRTASGGPTMGWAREGGRVACWWGGQGPARGGGGGGARAGGRGREVGGFVWGRCRRCSCVRGGGRGWCADRCRGRDRGRGQCGRERGIRGCRIVRR